MSACLQRKHLLSSCSVATVVRIIIVGAVPESLNNGIETMPGINVVEEHTLLRLPAGGSRIFPHGRVSRIEDPDQNKAQNVIQYL